MRIALIHDQNNSAAVELGRKLSAAGCEIVLSQATGFELLALLKQSFDVVHGFGRLDLLLFADTINAPLLISLLTEPSEAELSVCRQAGSRCRFVAQGCAAAGLNLLARDAQDYQPLYADLIKLCAREDVRPWGHYEVLSDDRPDHKIKRITVQPGKRLSLQLHHRRAEHWLIVSGLARVTLGEEFFDLGPGQAIDIPVEAAHRIENIGSEPVVFIEVQQGDYFGEDDIVRLQDDFGRN